MPIRMIQVSQPNNLVRQPRAKHVAKHKPAKKNNDDPNELPVMFMKLYNAYGESEIPKNVFSLRLGSLRVLP